jgi:hypothetical protein
MNKRLQELYLVASEQLKIVQDQGLPAPYQTRAFAEKFAELIVKECASICELNGQSYKHSFTPAKARLAESTSKYCGELVKRYFGIKE